MKAKEPVHFQTIALIGRTRLQKEKGFIERLKKYLEKEKKTVIWDEHVASILGKEEKHERSYLLKHADMVITLGGDGTILKVMRELPKRKDLYVFGINLGNVGFLAEVKDKTKVFEMLDEFFAGIYHVDERLLLRVTHYRGNKKMETHLALNDAVINQGKFARLIQLRAEIDQRKMIVYKGDGLIVATPTGSTGHSLSAGGPIIHPRIDAFVFTPICPADLSVRPIAIPSNRQLNITIETERKYDDNTIGLTIDGQIVIPVKYGDQVKIRRSSRKLRFIRKSGMNGKYYRLLRDKLSWGKR